MNRVNVLSLIYFSSNCITVKDKVESYQERKQVNA